MKKILSLLFVLIPVCGVAQNQDLSKYMAGAVTLNEAGYVSFKKHYDVKDKSKGEIYHLLKNYAINDIVGGENSLPQARIQDADSLGGLVVAGMEEYLYFKRTAWTNHRVRFYYQLIFNAADGGFDIEMRNLRYIYDDMTEPQTYRAEEWITDEAALNKTKTKLLKTPGKFRRFTIDRKNEIFRGAAAATGVEPKYKVVKVISDED